MSKFKEMVGNFTKQVENKIKKSENKTSPSAQNSVDDLFSVWSATSSVGLKWSHLSMNQLQKEDDENVISLVNDLFLSAIQKGASDIHIEPNDKDIKIRLRIDGNFIHYKKIDIKKANSLIARIKILAYLRIDEQRLPQDGKINFNLFWGKSIDLRVSVLPNIYGEKVVIRILKKEEKPGELKNLWIFPYNMVKIQKHLQDTHGMILAVGPTWSWKSTTLFSLLSQFEITSTEKKVIQNSKSIYRLSTICFLK